MDQRVDQKFHNQSDGVIVDDLGKINARIKQLQDEASELKDELESRGVEFAQGEHFTLSVTEVESKRIDKHKIIKKFGEKAYLQCCSKSKSRRFNVKPIAVTA